MFGIETHIWKIMRILALDSWTIRESGLFMRTFQTNMSWNLLNWNSDQDSNFVSPEFSYLDRVDRFCRLELSLRMHQVNMATLSPVDLSEFAPVWFRKIKTSIEKTARGHFRTLRQTD